MFTVKHKPKLEDAAFGIAHEQEEKYISERQEKTL